MQTQNELHEANHETMVAEAKLVKLVKRLKEALKQRRRFKEKLEHAEEKLQWAAEAQARLRRDSEELQLAASSAQEASQQLGELRQEVMTLRRQLQLSQAELTAEKEATASAVSSSAHRQLEWCCARTQHEALQKSKDSAGEEEQLRGGLSMTELHEMDSQAEATSVESGSSMPSSSQAPEPEIPGASMRMLPSLRRWVVHLFCPEADRSAEEAVETLSELRTQDMVLPSNLKAAPPTLPRLRHNFRAMAYQVKMEAGQIHASEVLGGAEPTPDSFGKGGDGAGALLPDATSSSVGPCVSPPLIPCQHHMWRLRAYEFKTEDRLKAAEGKLRRIGKALQALLSDPITEQPMHKPVVTPDGTTYDFASIMQWISQSETDPRTRMTLLPWMLRPNRQAEALAFLLRQNFPELQVELASACNNGRDVKTVTRQAPQLARDEIVDAILYHDTNEALEMLAGPVEDEILNGEFEYLGERGSLLWWALSHRLPDVALALVRRRDFRAFFFPTPLGMSHLHFAAALGYKAVCRELLQRQPLQMALTFTWGSVDLEVAPGHWATFPTGSTAMTIARQQGYKEIWELFNTAIVGAKPIIPYRIAEDEGLEAWRASSAFHPRILSTWS